MKGSHSLGFAPTTGFTFDASVLSLSAQALRHELGRTDLQWSTDISRSCSSSALYVKRTHACINSTSASEDIAFHK